MLAAESVFEGVLSEIRKSDLNFLLTETPFSVTIVIKKSFTRSKDANSMQLKNIDQSTSKPVAKQELYKNFSRQKKISSSFLLDQNIRSPNKQHYPLMSMNKSNRSPSRQLDP